MANGKRTFKPLVLQSKEQLLAALKQGKLESSKYNTLNDEEKLYVELLVFGEYNPEDAIRAVYPKSKMAPKLLANKMLANPNVSDTISELSIQKDAKFMAEISSARELALSKLKYIMATTQDEAVAASCAKIILDKAEKIILDANKKNEDDAVSGITFAIQVDQINVNPRKEAAQDADLGDTIVVDVDDEDVIEVAKKFFFHSPLSSPR